jgi:hypothetical protein
MENSCEEAIGTTIILLEEGPHIRQTINLKTGITITYPI